MKPVRPVLISLMLTVLFAFGADRIPGNAAEAARESIALPQPHNDSSVSLEKALQTRRSVRHYQNLPIALSDLSQLLWAAQGVTAPGGKRTAPSAGALYPLVPYVVAGAVKDLSAGVYSYDPTRHRLSRIADGDFRAELCAASLGQTSIRNAAVVLVIAAVYGRTTVKYGQRGIRYVHLEAGHAAQNVYLEATALGLGTVTIGAFDDDRVKAVLRLPAQEQPLSLMPVGRK